MINFVFERLVGFQVFSMQWHHDADDEDDDDENAKHATLPPEHALPMVPWYSMFMFDTGFQDYLFDHLAEKDDVWFDFMADCGDGFNSSFQIARMLAQPHLKVTVPLTNATFPRHDSVTLPRGNCLVIGGDLAYPHPDADSYEYAMKPPTWYDPAVISTKKPTLPRSCQSLKEYAGPTCFAIPGRSPVVTLDVSHRWGFSAGNHDWFDGLNTYSRFVCERDWLGGWHLPQNTSFFALQLPHGWWVFGCDLALEDDINVEQFACFEAIVEAHIGPTDRVIIVTHEPSWILDAYEHRRSEEKLQYLITTILAGRVVVRLAGDVHNYTRHSLMEYDQPQEAHPTGTASANAKPRSTPSLSVKTSASNENLTSMSPFSPVAKHFPHMNDVKHPSPAMDSTNPMPSIATEIKPAPEAPAHLIVSGGGGAFLHPTHVPSGDNLVASQRLYTRASCYPSEKVCRCRLVISVATSLCHSMAAFSVLIAFESMFQAASDGYLPLKARRVTLCWTSGALGGDDGVDALYKYYQIHVPNMVQLRSYDYFSLIPLYSTCVKYILTIFDGTVARFLVVVAHGDRSLVPQAVAVYRTDICQAGFDSLTRSEVLAYYCSVFLYFWVAATPLSGVIVGVYLYLAVNVFHSHYNEAFSALRVASYKNFLRLHIKSNGDLEIFALGVDKMPTKWIRDPDWSGATQAEKVSPSYEWKVPSYWKPKMSRVDNILRFDMEEETFDRKFNTDDRSQVKLVDYVVYHKDA
ncbi:hypothetical protein DYB32_009127 [Aphanomyces invadans]|uniref:Calcineurin-like phosphoesterase domain-containing protein n=1 Tax=Aphanomyces invadans TaxID=157072 RepID=A0A418AW63_9STRA|nr:hypothetical protein DYB32_009127 [Aphanomyces invadans]